MKKTMLSPIHPGEILRAISADTALRLAKFFGLSDHFWIHLQVHYDMDCAKLKLEKTLHDLQPLALHAA